MVLWVEYELDGEEKEDEEEERVNKDWKARTSARR